MNLTNGIASSHFKNLVDTFNPHQAWRADRTGEQSGLGCPRDHKKFPWELAQTLVGKVTERVSEPEAWQWSLGLQPDPETHSLASLRVNTPAQPQATQYYTLPWFFCPAWPAKNSGRLLESASSKFTQPMGELSPIPHSYLESPLMSHSLLYVNHHRLSSTWVFRPLSLFWAHSS